MIILILKENSNLAFDNSAMYVSFILTLSSLSHPSPPSDPPNSVLFCLLVCLFVLITQGVR